MNFQYILYRPFVSLVNPPLQFNSSKKCDQKKKIVHWKQQTSKQKIKIPYTIFIIYPINRIKNIKWNQKSRAKWMPAVQLANCGTTPWRATTFSDNSCENENSMNGKGWSIFISFQKAFPKWSLAPTSIESQNKPNQRSFFSLTRYFYVRQYDFSLFLVVFLFC